MVNSGFFRDPYHEGWCTWYVGDDHDERGVLNLYVEASTEDMVLRFGRLGPPEIWGQDWEPDFEIALTRTRCKYGGFRYWFLCPLCYRRIAAWLMRVRAVREGIPKYLWLRFHAFDFRPKTLFLCTTYSMYVSISSHIIITS